MKRIVLPGFAAGICMLIATMVLGTFTNTLFPQLSTEYQNSGMFRPWTDPLMSLYFFHPILLGFILSAVWDKTKMLFVRTTWLEHAMQFTFWYILVATVSGMFITYSTFQVSLLMVSTWTINGILEAIVAGLIFAKMNSAKTQS